MGEKEKRRKGEGSVGTEEKPEVGTVWGEDALFGLLRNASKVSQWII